MGGDAALYFDPLSAEEMSSALSRVLADQALYRSMTERGRFQARRFHPDAIRARIESFWAEISGRGAERFGEKSVAC